MRMKNDDDDDDDDGEALMQGRWLIWLSYFYYTVRADAATKVFQLDTVPNRIRDFTYIHNL